jgi:hypothetical protein
MMDTEQILPKCQLTGVNGNVYAIIGKVDGALKRTKLPERAAEFTRRAFECQSYDEVLQLCFKFVDVS